MSRQIYRSKRGPALTNFLSCSELLHLTFEHCLPEGKVLIHPEHAPLKLTFVCKYWKNIVESSSRFWNSFRLELSGIKRKEDIELYKGIVKYCLKNSGSLPLQVSIIKPDRTAQNLFQPLFKLFKLVRGHIHRWHDMEFSLPGFVLENESYDAVFKAPMLRKFHLDFTNEYLEDREIDSFQLNLRRCYNLEELSVHGRRMQEEYDRPRNDDEVLPVIYCFRCPPNLKVLEMNDIFFARPFNVDDEIFIEDTEDDNGYIDPLAQTNLRNGFSEFWPTNAWKVVLTNVEICPEFLPRFHLMFPCLTWLEIKNAYRYWVFDYSFRRGVWEMKLPKLQRLSLMVLEWQLLSALRTPELTWLELDEGYSVERDDPEALPQEWELRSDVLINFIKTNNLKFMLTTFKLTSVSITEDELITILRRLPTLLDLSLNIQYNGLTDEFLHAIANGKNLAISSNETVGFVGDITLCPSVVNLRIESGTEDSEHDFSVDAVTALARSRGRALGVGQGRATRWESLELPVSKGCLEAVLKAVNVKLTSTL